MGSSTTARDMGQGHTLTQLQGRGTKGNGEMTRSMTKVDNM